MGLPALLREHAHLLGRGHAVAEYGDGRLESGGIVDVHVDELLQRLSEPGTMLPWIFVRASRGSLRSAGRVDFDGAAVVVHPIRDARRPTLKPHNGTI
jgi:hypothetical protein